MVRSTLTWVLILILAMPANLGGMFSQRVAASPGGSSSQEIQTRRKALSALREIIRKNSSNHYGNTAILERADQAYAKGNLRQGDIFLTRFVLQHDKGKTAEFLNRSRLTFNERMALVGILKKHAPKQLKRMATDTLLAIRQAISHLHEEEKNDRGLTEALSPFRNQLMDSAVGRATDTLAQMHIYIARADVSAAVAFFRDFSFFSYEMQRLADAVFNRFESSSKRATQLSMTYVRLISEDRLKPRREEMRKYYDYDKEVFDMDLHEIGIRATYNTNTAKAAGTSGALTAAVIGLTAVTILSVPLGPEATAPLAGLTTKATVAATALWVGASTYNVIDHLMRDGASAIQDTEVMMDIAIVALTAATFGTAKFASPALSKLSKLPVVDKSLEKMAGIAQRTGITAFTTRAAPYFRATGSGAIAVGSLGLGGWMIADAEEIAQKTGQSVTSVRLQGVLICVIGILGGKQFYNDLKAIGKKQAAAEWQALQASQGKSKSGAGSSGSRSSSQKGKLSGLAAKQEAEAQKQGLFKKMNNCLDKLPPAAQKSITWQLFAENFAGTAAVKLVAVGAGWLSKEDIPAEALMWLNRLATSPAKTLTSIKPNDRYWVRWYKYSQLNTLTVPTSGIIYVLTPGAANESWETALQKRVAFDFTWGLASTMINVPAERFFAGWACIAKSPIMRVANLVSRSGAGLAMGNLYHSIRFVVTGD